ncbi:hypothetical protein ABZ547_06130 [Streptomyces sparsogenes]|uniref:hypothetical protein n=1 Tax=Streptomyces sparsogenes TaxID=67365 RepID=UPI0033EF4BB0
MSTVYIVDDTLVLTRHRTAAASNLASEAGGIRSRYTPGDHWRPPPGWTPENR